MSAPGVRGQARGPVLSRCCSRGLDGEGCSARLGGPAGQERILPVRDGGAVLALAPRGARAVLPGKPRYRGDPEAVPGRSPGP